MNLTLTAATLLGLLLAPPASAPGPASAPATAPALSGRLDTQAGITVVELWGSPDQAGYAQGWLLGAKLVRLFDEVLLDPDLGTPPPAYEGVLRPLVERLFTWEPQYEQELAGILRGLRARLGPDGARSARLDRPLDLDDLKVVNTLADWRGVLCSSLSAWGSLTADGGTLTARNLDYPGTPTLRRAQIVVIRRGQGDARPWIGVSWPGIIGVYTGMNDAGVTLSIHDASGLPPTNPAGLTPRALALREALEAAGPEQYVEDVRRVLARRRVLVGNNVHVSGPAAARDPAHPPAVVFEYDGNERDGGVTMRGPGTDRVPAEALCCTNHMRSRRPASGCERYAQLTDRLVAARDAGEKLDPAAALAVIRAVANETTVHSVVFVPARRELWVQIDPAQPAPARFDLAAWLARGVGAARKADVASATGDRP